METNPLHPAEVGGYGEIILRHMDYRIAQRIVADGILWTGERLLIPLRESQIGWIQKIPAALQKYQPELKQLWISDLELNAWEKGASRAAPYGVRTAVLPGMALHIAELRKSLQDWHARQMKIAERPPETPLGVNHRDQKLFPGEVGKFFVAVKGRMGAWKVGDLDEALGRFEFALHSTFPSNAPPRQMFNAGIKLLYRYHDYLPVRNGDGRATRWGDSKMEVRAWLSDCIKHFAAPTRPTLEIIVPEPVQVESAQRPRAQVAPGRTLPEQPRPLRLQLPGRRGMER